MKEDPEVSQPMLPSPPSLPPPHVSIATHCHSPPRPSVVSFAICTNCTPRPPSILFYLFYSPITLIIPLVSFYSPITLIVPLVPLHTYLLPPVATLPPLVPRFFCQSHPSFLSVPAQPPFFSPFSSSRPGILRSYLTFAAGPLAALRNYLPVTSNGRFRVSAPHAVDDGQQT